MLRKAFITGVTGQDGHYLSDLLVAEGTKVYGLVRRSSRDTDGRGVPENIEVVDGDVCDPHIQQAIVSIDPDEVYNLAAMSHVGDSFDQPSSALAVNACGALNVLEGARQSGARFYQASTSELFGNAPAPQSEYTPFQPRSPYACAKAAAFHLTAMYRDAYGMHASNGILFNHESPLRGSDFVTQKVCMGVARIMKGEQFVITLGNLESRRDWGHAKDFVRGMVAMVRQSHPSDYVLATGKTRTVRELLDVAFEHVGIADWNPFVTTDKNLRRPLDVQNLLGDASKAHHELDWYPQITFAEMIGEMIDAQVGADDVGRGGDRSSVQAAPFRLYDGRGENKAVRA